MAGWMGCGSELTFTHDTEEYGMLISKELKPGGGDIPVTNENRDEYVALYVDHVINTLPSREIADFQKGFKMVMDGRAFQLCTPKELEMIVVGSPVRRHTISRWLTLGTQDRTSACVVCH
jgi:hypothetical protein